ncbi:SH3 domain-containing protein [Streptomyces sp. NPDC002643]
MKRLTALVPMLAAVAVAVPLSLATPAAAHASCGTSVSDRDGSGWVRSANGVNMRSGSSTGCSSNGIAYSSHSLDYHCYTVGNDGYTWTYTRNDATGVYGWMRDDVLSDGGSLVYCGF